jgi:hypothetical protein
MLIALFYRPRLLACQPPDPQEVRARRARRWRLLILILVGAVVVGLSLHGYTVAAALSAITGAVLTAKVVARYVLGAVLPTPRTA